MRDCKQHRGVHAYHDGELPAREAKRVEAHLDACAFCRLELQRLRAMSQWLAAAPAPRVTTEILARLRRGLRPARERAMLRLAKAVTAAAAAVLIVCSALLWRSREEPTQTAAATAEWETYAVSAGQTDGTVTQETTDDVDIEIARALLGNDSESGFDDED